MMPVWLPPHLKYFKNYPKLPPELKMLAKILLHLELWFFCLIKTPLSPNRYYWYNLPKKHGFPFLALVEHTNFIDSG
jgi:hypothetical protein